MSKLEQLTLCAAGFPVSRSPSPGSAEARKMTATSGRKCSALSRKRDPLGCLERTLLASSAWHSTECLLTWRPQATPAGRLLYRLVPSMHPSDATGCGLWPTPDTMQGGRKVTVGIGNAVALWATPTLHGNSNRKGAGPNSGDGIATQVALWATPTARDHKSIHASAATHDHNSRPLSEQVGAALNGSPAQTAKPGASQVLNPAFVEWLMGYPPGWTQTDESP